MRSAHLLCLAVLVTASTFLACSMPTVSALGHGTGLSTIVPNPPTLGVGSLGQGAKPTPSQADIAALERLRAAGSDFSQVHQFDFYLYHKDKPGADSLCRYMQDHGFQVAVTKSADSTEWLCLASKSFVPSIDAVTEYGALIESGIKTYGGEYDGWETAVVPQ